MEDLEMFKYECNLLSTLTVRDSRFLASSLFIHRSKLPDAYSSCFAKGKVRKLEK